MSVIFYSITTWKDIERNVLILVHPYTTHATFINRVHVLINVTQHIRGKLISPLQYFYFFPCVLFLSTLLGLLLLCLYFSFWCVTVLPPLCLCSADHGVQQHSWTLPASLTAGKQFPGFQFAGRAVWHQYGALVLLHTEAPIGWHFRRKWGAIQQW